MKNKIKLLNIIILIILLFGCDLGENKENENDDNTEKKDNINLIPFTVNPSASNINSSGFDVTFTVNEDGRGAVYILEANIDINTVELLSFEDVSISVTAGKLNTFSYDDLKDSTSYSVYTMFENLNGDTMENPFKFNVKTLSDNSEGDSETGDIISPLFVSEPEAKNIDISSFDISASINEDGMIYLLVSDEGSSIPSIDEIRSGESKQGQADTKVIFNIASKSPETTYDIYLIAVDDSDNISDIYTIEVTTLTEDIPAVKIADHSIVNVLKAGEIPESAITGAKDKLHIAYGHTSHGSQITDGMTGLVEFANNGNLGTNYSQDLFEWNHEESDGALHLFEGAGYGDGYLELDGGYAGWDDQTRTFLDAPENSDYNVIMWSWCGQVSGKTEESMKTDYLDRMSSLETEYPDVTFIYMTGHLDGTGEDGNLHLRNEQIREYCEENDKWLFDFADIESYDPDGNYYLDKDCDDGCNYDSNGDGNRDTNWATAWQNSHTEGSNWYSCGSAHSEALNANMKAYAVWWLWARLGGWNE